MKKLILFVFFIGGINAYAQTNEALKKHYEAYYKQMKLQGDTRGAINALTHLTVLDNNPARKDTLAFFYMNNGQHMQALNTIGIDKDANASEIAVRVKAISLKAMRQPQRAIEQFEILYNRKSDPYLAYELADLYIQTGNNATASVFINYGLANAKDEMKQAFYESKPAYEVPLKAAFMYMKALIQFNNNVANIDTALATIEEALKIAPNFNLATITKNALTQRKNNPEEKK